MSASEGSARVRVVPMASKPLRLAVPGVDYPMLRGLLAFLLSYVPDIGSISPRCRRYCSRRSGSDRGRRCGRPPATSW